MKARQAAVVGFMVARFLSCSDCEEVEDLGVITRKKPILLQACKERKDFAKFTIRVPAHGWQTNDVQLSLTNSILTEEDLKNVPQGLATLEVRSVCADGEESPIAVFKIDIQRNPPAKPKAKAFIAPPAPPMPGVPMFNKRARPLPNGTNETYAAFQQRIHQTQNQVVPHRSQ